MHIKRLYNIIKSSKTLRNSYILHKTTATQKRTEQKMGNERKMAVDIQNSSLA